MRRWLDGLYLGSGALAAVFLALIAVVALAQVVASIIDTLASWTTGAPIGIVVPSYADFGGFFLAAASFLALAYSLRRGSHIRVSLLIQRLGAESRQAVELWCVFAGALIAAYFAWHMTNLMLDSLAFGDVSYGLVPVPLWIPQASLALGLVVLTVALIDEYFAILKGRTPSYEAGDEGPGGE